MLKQSPSLKFYHNNYHCALSETFHHNCQRFAYQLIIEGAQWIGECSVSQFVAKDNSAQVAFEELKKIKTEHDLRHRLGMPIIIRNPEIEVIRQQLKMVRHKIQQKYKSGPIYRALGQAYAAIDQIEKELSINE